MKATRTCLASVCAAWLLLAAPLAWGQVGAYSQNFESLDQAGSTALSADGWLAYGNVFTPSGGYLDGYGPYSAPNGSGSFSNIAAGEGGPNQGAQQLVTFSDYNNAEHTAGNLVEANVYQERTVTADDVGKTFRFRFDAKRGDIAAPSTAFAFIKTLDPNSEYALTNFVTGDTTSLPGTWSTYALELTIDASLVGHIFQFGFASTATNFKASGNVYDNVVFGEPPGCEDALVLADQTLPTFQIYEGKVSATLGANLIANGSNLVVNAPTVILTNDVAIGGSVRLGNVPGCPTAINVNIDDPTLTVANNSAVSSGDTLTLVWSDEFDGGQLDPEVWFFESGDGSQYGIPGWGNNEEQWYLSDNAELKDGMLVITAREESEAGKDYTSARINTRDRFAFRYGRIEARMRLPGGQGLWPAFWLLPQDDSYGTWAASGEIDVMEAVNLGAAGGNRIHGTIHYGGAFPANVSSGSDYWVATDATTDFHDYALEWDETEMRWYVDDVLYGTKNSWYTTSAGSPAPFDQPFYILFNVAVGGNWPGPPDASSVFPVSMQVDYVRVYSGDPD